MPIVLLALASLQRDSQRRNSTRMLPLAFTRKSQESHNAMCVGWIDSFPSAILARHQSSSSASAGLQHSTMILEQSKSGMRRVTLSFMASSTISVEKSKCCMRRVVFSTSLEQSKCCMHRVASSASRAIKAWHASCSLVLPSALGLVI